MKLWLTTIVAIYSLALASDVLLAQSTQPTTQPAGSVAGAIKLPAGALTFEIVVYLSPGNDQSIAAPAQPVKVAQKGAVFRPALVVVCIGQTVEFVNDEDRPIDHNVFSNSPAMQFDLGLYKPGDSRSVTFNKPGPVLVYCSIHRNMDGAVYVSPTPYFCVVKPDGTAGDLKYQISGVPEGRWIVQTWQHQRRFHEAQAVVVVEAGKCSRQDLQLDSK